MRRFPSVIVFACALVGIACLFKYQAGIQLPLFGAAVIVHPNTYHPEVGYIVLGDAVVVTDEGVEVLGQTPRELFEVAA